jgi:protein-tyrosine phosphatase
MAERLAIALAGELGIPGVSASSAGVRAMIGHDMHPDAAQIIELYGGDPSGFAARQIKPKIAGEADLILTMTREHRHAVLEMAPRQLRRTFTLKEAAAIVNQAGVQQIDGLAASRAQVPANDLLDIADPIGQSAEFFADVGEQIVELLPDVLNLCRTPQN